MPYFTFTFREQVFQAQYELVAGSAAGQYRVTDLPAELQSLADPEMLFRVNNGNIDKPGWDLGDALSDGLNQTLKGISHF